MRQRSWGRVVLVGLLAALVVACRGGGESAPANAPAAAPQAATPVPVTTAAVQVSQEPVTIRATGTFIAAESSQVSPKVPGQVIATPVDVGAVVRTGEVIARLDDRDARTRLAQASATLQQVQATAANARAQAERSANLVKTGDISTGDYQTLTTSVATAAAQVAQAEAQVTQAQQQLEDTIVHAPFRGHVSARPVAAGEYVTTASAIATIVRIQPIKLELQIPEIDAARITIGMRVGAQVASYPEREFSGTVTAKNPALDIESRALTAVAEFKNDDLAISPGMFATAAVRLAQTQQVIAVPKAAVFAPAGTPSSQVFVVQDGKARLRVVQTGPAQGDLIPIPTGLEPTDVVVTSSPDQLFDGQPVVTQ